MTKILPAVFGAICVWLALNPPAFMGVMVWIGISGVASATLAPMLFALLWPKRVNAAAAIIGLIAGEGTYVILYLITKIEKSVMAAGAWGVVASFIAMWIASSFTAGSKETTKA
jgi:Na+/proline symporter